MVWQLSAELMLYVLAGIYLQKRQLVSRDFEKQISVLLLEVVLPVMIVRSMQIELTADDLRNCAFLLLLCTGWTLFSFLFGQGLWYMFGKGASGRIFRFGSIFTNFTFIGLPVMNTAFDGQTVFYFTVYVIPLRIALYAFCEQIMTPPERYAGSGGFSWRKLCSAPLIAVAVGITLCLLDIRFPAALDTAMAGISALSLPLGMMVCGLIIGKFSPRQVFSPKALLMTLIRNLLLPGLALLVCRTLDLIAPVTRCVVMCAAFPVGTLLATFATKYDGCEQSRYESAGAVIFSHLTASLTIPLWVWLLSIP